MIVRTYTDLEDKGSRTQQLQFLKSQDNPKYVQGVKRSNHERLSDKTDLTLQILG